jgi:hypothetical protein
MINHDPGSRFMDPGLTSGSSLFIRCLAYLAATLSLVVNIPMPEWRGDPWDLAQDPWSSLCRLFIVPLPFILAGMYISAAKQGVGRTTPLHNLMVEDIHVGRGFALFDPHGDEAENLLNFIPQHCVEDVIYFAPQDHERPVTFNP